MIFNNDTDPRDSKPDYFDGEDLPETKKERRRHYSDDDPRYWEEEDEHGEWDHLRPLLRWKVWALIGSVVIVIALSSFVYIRYFRPFTKGAVQYGYVESIQPQGVIFKTFEGVMLPYRNLMDTLRLYNSDFVFTALNDSVAADLLRASSQNKPVKVEYTRYNATVPWRGDSRIVVTAVSPADPRLILPPDRLPETALSDTTLTTP